MIANSTCRIATFYSYKGGTGRSMMLANFAWILAAGGKRVLVLDWDLEAPGLHRYFRPFLVDADLVETEGLIDVFWRYAATALAKDSPGGSTQKEWISLGQDLEETAIRLDTEFAAGGHIDLISAGRQSATYSERVNTFNWARFYEVGGAQALAAAKEHLRPLYDWILIDSRTGVSDTSGICTMHMPDCVVPCFTLNRQSIDGCAAVLRSIKSYRSQNINGSLIDIYPIATRIENAEHARLEKARAYARQVMQDFLPPALASGGLEYWNQMEISYRPAYAFEEVLAAFGDSTGAAGAADTMLAQVEKVAQCITGNPSLRMPEILETDRSKVLSRYALAVEGNSPEGGLSSAAGASATSATQPPAPSLAQESDTEFLRGLLAKEQLWRTQGFKWHYLMSQREMDLLTDADRKSFGRSMTYYFLQSTKAVDMIQRANQAFIFCLMFGLAAGIAMYSYFSLAYARTTSPFLSDPLLSFISIYFGFAAHAAASLISGGVLHNSQFSPYGMTPFSAVRFVILGPFKRPITDLAQLQQEKRGHDAH